MKYTHVLFYFVAATAPFTASVRAQQIITTPDTGSISSIGPGGSSAYAQSLTVPVSNTQLQSFTFTGVTSDTNSSFDYKTYVYAFNPGTRTVTGSAIYVGPVQNIPATGKVSSTITPNVTLTGGGTYLIIFTANGLTQTAPNSSSAYASMDTSGNTYAGGDFYFTNGAPFSSTYVDAGVDTAFSATFGSSTFLMTGLNANQQSTLGSVNQGIVGGNATAAFTALTSALTSAFGSQGTLAGALDQLSPVQFGNFTGATAFNNATFQVQGQDDYTAGRRGGQNGTFLGGNGGIDSSGLTINDPSYDSNLSMVHSRLLAWNPGSLHGAISDIGQPVLGGIDMKDARDAKETASNVAEYTDPWNFYIRGNGIVAQGFSQADTPHFDDTTESVELGIDYRLTPNFLVGLTAGYGHTDASLDNFGSTATVDSYSPGFYASYADHGWYANAQGSYVHNAYTQDRHIDFLGQTASSAPQGNEGVADLDGGYEFHRGAFTFGPLAGITYTHLSVNGYSESGSVADLSVQGQESDSLRSRLGGRVQYAFSHFGLVFKPHFEASWQHEFMDGARGITSSLDAAGLGSFNVRTSNPSRDFALTDLGLDADINRTVGVFVDYIVQAGQDNYFGQSFQGGVKIGF